MQKSRPERCVGMGREDERQEDIYAARNTERVKAVEEVMCRDHGGLIVLLTSNMPLRSQNNASDPEVVLWVTLELY